MAAETFHGWLTQSSHFSDEYVEVIGKVNPDNSISEFTS